MKKNNCIIDISSLVDYIITKDDEIDCLKQKIIQKEKIIEEVKKEIYKLHLHEFTSYNLEVFYDNIREIVNYENK